MRQNIDISCLDDPAELTRLQAIWRQLHDTHGTTVFQSWEWAQAWWNHFSDSNPQRRLQLLTAREHDRLVGIVPLANINYRVAPHLRVPLTVSFGRPMADYLGWLIEPERIDAVTAAVAAYLARLPNPTLLEEVNEQTAVGTALQSAAEQAGIKFILEPGEPTSQLNFSNHWPEIELSISRRRRKLGRDFQLDFELISEQRELPAAMADFIALHQYGWQKKGQPGALRTPHTQQFLSEVAERFLDRGWLAFAFLRINGVRVAVHFGFQFGSTMSGYLYGLGDTGEAAKYSPGQVLIEYMIEQAHEKGHTTYDYLRGGEGYKLRLPGAVQSQNTNVMLVPASLRAQLTALLWQIYRLTKKRLLGRS